MSDEAFDIIGDVHGQAGKLLGLLEILGYRQIDGVWSHPAIEVGPGYIIRKSSAGEATIFLRKQFNADDCQPEGRNH